jgi:hypothetical protein
MAVHDVDVPRMGDLRDEARAGGRVMRIFDWVGEHPIIAVIVLVVWMSSLNVLLHLVM